DQHYRVAHHVVQHAAALQRALPEPRLVRTTMFLGGAREVGTARECDASLPDDLAAGCDGRRKNLILEISMEQAGALNQFKNSLSFRDISSQRLLARQTLQRSPALFNGVDDLFNIFNSSVIWAAKPDGINGRIGHHIRDRAIHFGLAHIESAGKRGGSCSVLFVRTPDTQD